MLKFDLRENDFESFAIQIVLIIVSYTINAYVINVCWNEYLIHAISGLHEIDMWQALAIRVLFTTSTAGFSFERTDR